FYIQRLENERPKGFDVIYAVDHTAVPRFEGVQAITRSPRIFEYLYRNFELQADDNGRDRHEFSQRSHPRDVTIDELSFSTSHQVVNSGTLNLDTPSMCGLVRVQIRIDYGKSPTIFAPAAVALSLSDGDRPVWRGYVRPLEPNHTFVTYISQLPPETFHRVFGQGPVQTSKW